MSSDKTSFHSLPDWLQWLETLHPVEIDLGLERIREVAERLDLLQTSQKNTQAKIITVAGTNGKGSFVETLKRILLHQGLSVGAYTSPHLLRYNERISINGVFATDAEICEAFAEIESARASTSLTYFEFGTLAALYLFKQKQLDYWILEVGLGGRLDAVNILDADIAVITSIALDHETWLGNTREKIALEKAGITRKGGQLILADTEEPASLNEFIRNQALSCLRLNQDFFLQYEQGCLTFRYQTLSATTERSIALDIQPALPAPSIAAALMAAQLLEHLPSEEVLSEVFASLTLTGRCQQLEFHNKKLVLDVAHNPAASHYLAAWLQQQQMNSVSAIVAIMADKDIPGVLGALVPQVGQWCCCDLPGNKRAASAASLRDNLLELNVAPQSITLHASPVDALNACSEYNSSVVLVFGSFYTVENILKYLEDGKSG